MDKEQVKSFLKKYFIIEIALFVLLVVIDQVAKMLAVKYLKGLSEPVTAIPFLFNFTYVENRGAAFGLGEGMRWVFVVVTILALGIFGFATWKFRSQGYFMTVSLAVVMAGALGNMIDRMFLGYVVDFIQFGFWESFPVFNIADSALVVGVILLAIYIIFFYKETKKPQVAAAETVVAAQADEPFEEKSDEVVRSQDKTDGNDQE